MKINSFFKAAADGTNGRGYLLPALRASLRCVSVAKTFPACKGLRVSSAI